MSKVKKAPKTPVATPTLPLVAAAFEEELLELEPELEPLLEPEPELFEPFEPLPVEVAVDLESPPVVPASTLLPCEIWPVPAEPTAEK